METVLIEGRLHPAAIAIDVISAVRRSLLYLSLLALQAIFTRDGTAVFVTGGLITVLSVAIVALPILRYLRFRYRLTDESLYITSGIVARRQRRIPLDRIQDVSSEAKLVHRVLGVVKLSVQTSSTAGAEAELDCLSVEDARKLQHALDQATARARPAASEVAPRQKPEQELVYRADLRHILLRGLTDNRAGLIVLSTLAVLERLLDLRDLPPFAAVDSAVRESVGEVVASGIATLMAVGFVITILVFVLGWLSSAVANAVRFFGFTVRRSQDVFYRRYGLFTERVHALPMRRIQALRYEQTLLRRLVNIAVCRTDDMGSGAHDRSAESAGVDVFIPAGPRDELFALAPIILPGLRLEGRDWRLTSPTIVRRALIVSVVVAALSTAALFPFAQRWAFATWAVPPLAVAYALLRYRLLAWSAQDGFLAVRDGVLTRRHAFAPFAKIQALVYTQNPFDRRWGVGKLVAVVGGGTTVTISNLPSEDARALLAAASFSAAPPEVAATVSGLGSAVGAFP